ncbi:MAG: division/cell wall cluster transcriptional repressor MraZ, partial [Planctomycetota bacterium]
MLFVGTFELTIDAKQRMAIPADVRDRLPGDAVGQAFYCVMQEGPTLCLYTEEGFEKRARELDESERPPEEILLYEQMFYANARRLEVDKQGRVRLPERLLEMAGLGKDVVVLGVKDHLQVHDR